MGPLTCGGVDVGSNSFRSPSGVWSSPVSDSAEGWVVALVDTSVGSVRSATVSPGDNGLLVSEGWVPDPCGYRVALVAAQGGVGKSVRGNHLVPIKGEALDSRTHTVVGRVSIRRRFLPQYLRVKSLFDPYWMRQ